MRDCLQSRKTSETLLTVSALVWANRTIVGSIAVALVAMPCVFGQGVNYNYRYGDQRVIIQSETGLVHPSSTYIGPGTLSKSAQGASEVGAQVNPGLPKVNHGGFIGTPGDNMYGNNPIRAVEPKRMAAKRPVQIIYVRPQQPTAPKEYAYTPGQNAPLQYSSGGGDAAVQFDGSGAASYGNVPISDSAPKRY